MISLKGLYETHLTVSNLDQSIGFYRDVVGLELAHVIPERNVAFLWVAGRESSMLGLWSIHSSPLRSRLHIAFQTSLEQLLKSCDYLRSTDITPRDGAGSEIEEPIVFPWMPAASVYFDDPDGHSLEYIALLPDQPRRDIPGTLTFSKWKQIAGVQF